MSTVEQESQIEKLLNPADYLPSARTFLEWIRTGIAIMVFGFVVVKFPLFIK